METPNHSWAISPMDNRYIPKDGELLEKLLEYKDLDIFTKLNRIVPETVLPRLNSLKEELLDMGEKNKGEFTKRIDGQQDGRITVKEVFNGYAQRLAKRIKDIQKVPLNLDKLKEAERNDRISDLTYFSLSAFSVEANIANDIRHQFRNEIGEYSRPYQINRIGSSTMPHKINPAEYENIVSLWKANLPEMTSSLMSQVTEHQGDSTNEERPFYAFGLTCSLSYVTKSLKQSLKNLQINSK